MQDAIEAADSADPADPRSAPILLHAAELCLRANHLPRAASFAQRAAAAAPADPAPPRVLSGIRALQGQTDAAIAAAHHAVRLAPANPEIRLHLGGLLLSQSAWRQAADHLAVCTALTPDAPTPWRQLSAALQELGRTERALEAIDHAIALAPATVEYRVHRASLLAAAGRFAEALSALTRATNEAPADSQPWRALSSLHAALRDPLQALAAAQRAQALDPADPTHAAHLQHLLHEFGLAAVDTPADPAAYWTERPVRSPRPPHPRPGLPALCALQARIVFALLLREMRTRFARSRLGYIWAILEPASHIATLGSVFSLLNRAPPPVGDHLFEFYLTGLLPFLLFSHVSTEVMTGFAANAPVLHIPLVKRIDIILARALLALATELLVGILVLAVLGLIGWQALPADLLTAAAAILALWLMATGIGALNMVLVELLPAWETFFAALVRLLYFASGIYYSPIAMPGRIRAVLAYNPVLQAVEWFRSGFYAGYQPHWLDRATVLLWAAAALLAGLAAERALRRHIMVAA